MVTLSSSSNTRSGADKNVPENHLILTYQPVIISTANTPSLKTSIISSSTTLGYPCFPDDTDRSLVRATRPIPTTQFRKILHEAKVEALTLKNYGMKIPLAYSILYQKPSVLEDLSPSSSSYPLTPSTFPSQSDQTPSTPSASSLPQALPDTPSSALWTSGLIPSSTLVAPSR